MVVVLCVCVCVRCKLLGFRSLTGRGKIADDPKQKLQMGSAHWDSAGLYNRKGKSV